MSWIERSALRVAVFAAGALLMSLEVAAFRIIGKTFGSALRETTAVIAVFLAAMSIGYWAGGRAADRWPRSSTLVTTLLASAASLLVVPWIDATFSPRLAESSLALSLHAFLATTVLFAFPTVLFAATSPIAIRLFSTTTGHSGSTAGSISALSTAGSIAGSVATAFLLIDWLASVSATVVFVAAATCATALLVALTASGPAGTVEPRTRRALIAGAGLILLLLASTAFVRSASLDRSLTEELPNTRTIFLGDSPYHRVLVRDRGPLREVKFDLGIQSRMILRDPNGPGLPYTDAFHIGALMRPPKRVLLIGLGGGTAVRQFLHDYPGVEIDAVEVDPLIVDVAARFFHVTPGPRLRIHVMDGRTFLKRSAERWDLILVDAYTTNRYGDTMPPHLTTREFFQEASAHLTDNGILHYHCAYATSNLLPALHKTMNSVFPSVLRTEGELLASHVPMILQPEDLLDRAKRSPAARLPFLVPAIEGLRVERPRKDALLLTDDYAPVDTLLGRR